MWHRLIEVTGPTLLLGADAGNPSPYPLEFRIIRDPSQSVVVSMHLLPYAYPTLHFFPDMEPEEWRWNYRWFNDPIRIPPDQKLALEAWDPPAHTKGFFLLNGGIIVQADYAPD